MSRIAVAFPTFLSVILVAFITACGPKLSPVVNVPEVSPPAGLNVDRRARGSEIYVDTVLDSRPTTIITSFKGVDAQFTGDLTSVIRRVVEGVFRQKGLSLHEKAPVVINLEVKQWSAQFAPENSAKVDAQAELYLEVIGPANRKIYSGTYKGFSSFEGSPFDNKQLEELLKTAMNEAVRQLVHDQGLMDTITAF